MKHFVIKAYTSAGDYIGVLDDARFVGFTEEINAGQGECVLEIARQFDDTGIDIEIGTNIDIFVSDDDTSSETDSVSVAKRIYSGYISIVEPTVGSGRERIVLHLLGHYTRLSLDVLKNGTTTTLNTNATTGVGTGAAAAADIGLVVRGILDRYQAETDDSRIFYSAGSVLDASIDMNYSFERRTYRDAIDTVLASSGAGYFYFVGADGLFTFKTKGTTPTHKFIFDRHFYSLTVQRSLEKVRNVLLLWDGQAGGNHIHYEDAASISIYGRRTEVATMYGVQDSATMNIIGARFVDENKDPTVQITCDIFDNNNESGKGYDIESIHPGDTCAFYGIQQSLSEIMRENMLITKVQYSPDRVTITVEIRKSGIVDVQNDTVKKVESITSEGCPTTYS